MNRIDLTGETFDNLTVKKMIYGCKHGQTFCECLCKCGKTVVVNSAVLRKRRVYPKSCGCLDYIRHTTQANKSRKDLTGMRFGRLVVTNMVEVSGGKSIAECVCDCGEKVFRPAVYLTCGDTTSCGCAQRDAVAESNTKDFRGVISDFGIEFLSRSHQNSHGTWMWNCKCGCCGNTFIAMPAKVLSGHTSSCGCSRRSTMEIFVEQILIANGIEYEREYRFDECRDKYSLPFDFYIPRHNVAIECQGVQHYKPVEHFGGQDAFEIRMIHDYIKREYCNANNILLITIPYDISHNEIKSKIINTIYPERLSCPA